MTLTSLAEHIALYGGGEADLAVYEALLRQGLREPEDFAFGGTVDFVMRKVPRALAIVTPSRRRAGFLKLRHASMQGKGVELLIVDEAEALRDPNGLVDRLVRGG